MYRFFVPFRSDQCHVVKGHVGEFQHIYFFYIIIFFNFHLELGFIVYWLIIIGQKNKKVAIVKVGLPPLVQVNM